jgi:cytochrome c oxidase assembly protein subunit 15
MFKKLALLAAVMALCVVVLGAYVRLSDAGLGCPDWPGCYGTLTVPQSESAIAQAQLVYPHSMVEAGKAWKEMIHRYLAGALGVVVLALFVLGWTARKTLNTSPWTTTFLLGLISFQAALGMWTVTLLLKPMVVSGHLLGGMTTLGLLVWVAHRHWGQHNSEVIKTPYLRLTIRFALVVLFMQIFLGGWTSTNYAALACTDFPTCHGAWMPSTDFKDAFHLFRALGQSSYGGNLSLEALSTIQWVHRIGALITLLYLGFLAINGLKYKALKTLSQALILVLIAQIGLGIANLLLHLPLVLAVLHNLGAALLVVIIVVMNSKITALKNNAI